MKNSVIMPPISVIRYITCLWCRSPVDPVIDRYCPNCGHRAMALTYCDCQQCKKIPPENS